MAVSQRVVEEGSRTEVLERGPAFSGSDGCMKPSCSKCVQSRGEYVWGNGESQYRKFGILAWKTLPEQAGEVYVQVGTKGN